MAGATKKADITGIAVREIDFASRFSTAFTSLTDLLSVSGLISKPAGSNVVLKTAVADSALETSAAEATEIAYTNYNVTERTLSTLSIQKYRKGVSLEAIESYGYDVAVAKTDDAFLRDLQAKVSGDLFTIMNSVAEGSTSKTTFQMALATAKAEVIEQSKVSHISADGAVAWVNVNDFYAYEGAAAITVQTAFGLQYVENFLGFNKIFLCASSEVASGTILATATGNLNVFYVDAAQSDFAKAGLEYTTAGENNLVGVHIAGNYGTAVGDVFAIMGITIAPEYTNVLRKVTVGE